MVTSNAPVWVNKSHWLIVLGFNDTSTNPCGPFYVVSQRKVENRIVEEMKEEQGRKRNMNESEETEEIKTVPLDPYLL